MSMMKSVQEKFANCKTEAAGKASMKTKVEKTLASKGYNNQVVKSAMLNKLTNQR